MENHILEIIIGTIVSGFGALVVWAIRDVKLAIIKNTAEVNDLKVQVAKLQTMLYSGNERIKKLECEQHKQWEYIHKKADK